MKEEKKRVRTISILGVLQLIFITLKLTGLIDWTWVVVLTPLWIDLVITLILLAILGVAALYDNRKKG